MSCMMVGMDLRAPAASAGARRLPEDARRPPEEQTETRQDGDGC